MKFQNFIRSQKRLAANNLRDHHMQWDFWTLVPPIGAPGDLSDGDRGIPQELAGIMNGYSSHTYSWSNADGGEMFWVKYHFNHRPGVSII